MPGGMPYGCPAADDAEKTGTVVGKELAEDDSAPEAGGRAETEHTVTVAAGNCGRSPWLTLGARSCGCPSWDGPSKSEIGDVDMLNNQQTKSQNVVRHTEKNLEYKT